MRRRTEDAERSSAATPDALADLEFHPVTPDRWRDLKRLFGPRGACAGCWCMWWRIPRSEFERNKGEGNRRSLKRIVQRGDLPGLLAYAGGEPVGWCSIGPRASYPMLERSRTLKPVDERPVWSVVCFFVARPFRRRGLTARLLQAAVDHARKQGATIMEGYPVDPRTGTMPDAFAWTGFPGAFRDAGFVEVARRSATRPIMRRALRERGTRRREG